jgi:DNA-directed RNA polymerase beta subunit
MDNLTEEYKGMTIPRELGDVPPGVKNIDIWNILDLYQRSRGLGYYKAESYEIFLETVKDIIQKSHIPPLEDRKSQGVYNYSFGNVSIIPPTFTPQEARLRNLDYSVTIVADIIQIFNSPLQTVTQKMIK